MARILIIDDDVQIREMLRQMLEREGYVVVDAPNGKVAMKIQREKPADLIITDLIDVLPEGIVGLLAIAGFGLLLIKVIKDRLTNKEDNYYSKNVKL